MNPVFSNIQYFLGNFYEIMEGEREKKNCPNFRSHWGLHQGRRIAERKLMCDEWTAMCEWLDGWRLGTQIFFKQLIVHCSTSKLGRQ